jgi:hypothetical protein
MPPIFGAWTMESGPSVPVGYGANTSIVPPRSWGEEEDAGGVNANGKTLIYSAKSATGYSGIVHSEDCVVGGEASGPG